MLLQERFNLGKVTDRGNGLSVKIEKHIIRLLFFRNQDEMPHKRIDDVGLDPFIHAGDDAVTKRHQERSDKKDEPDNKALPLVPQNIAPGYFKNQTHINYC